jgi:predicted nucleotidyltransferase
LCVDLSIHMVSEPYASLLERLLAELRREFGDKLVSMVVFGSVARGDNRRDSDIDLLLVVEGIPPTVTGRVRLFEKVEDRLSIEDLRSKGYDVSFSPVIKTPAEAVRLIPLYLDMVDDAVILYDKDAFFTRVLERLRRRLSELGAERVRVGKKWYWRLKKDFKWGEVVVIE